MLSINDQIMQSGASKASMHSRHYATAEIKVIYISVMTATKGYQIKWVIGLVGMSMSFGYNG